MSYIYFGLQEGDKKIEAERMTMYKCILSNIIDSETNYVEWLGVLLKVCEIKCLFK